MDALLLNLGKLFLGFLCILGPAALLLAFRQVRDLRESALSLPVFRVLNLPDLRGLFSVKIQRRYVGADTVVVDLWGCSREQVWNVMETLSAKLPSHVRLEVNGLGVGRMKSAWTLTATRRFSSAALCP
jgi:hypothetical protein